MKTKFLSCFLFILCTQSVIILGFEGFPISKTEDFNLSKPRFGGKFHVRNTGVNVTNGLYEETDRRELNEKQEIVDSVKGQRGKGSYGGGNPARHAGSKKGAASLSASPCYPISAAVLHVSLALIGHLQPYFLRVF